MRPIDADAFAVFLVDHLPRTAPQEAYDAYFDVLQMLKDEKATPTADVVERKKGRWEMKWNGFFHAELPMCSQCLKFSPFKYDYCPKCGAEMGGNTDETN